MSEYLSLKGKRSARILPKKSVLVTCIGNLGRVGYNKEEVAFNQQINAILPISHIDFKYTFYQAQSASFRHQLESLSTSTTVALVNKSSFNSVKIVIAPLPIQRAIVSKIEALFSDLDNGIANFKKAQEQLKVYRQAVLKKAFEGKLSEPRFTGLNDEQDFEKSSQSSNQKNHSSDNLPKGWKWVKLGEVCEKIFDGPFGSNLKTDDYVNDGVRVIRLENIKSMNFDDSKKSYVSIDKYETIKRHTVYPTDIIMSTFISEKVNVCQMPETIKFAVNKADCIGIRLKNIARQKFVLYALSLRSVYVQLEVLVHGATRPRVNTNQIKNIKIPFCSLPEQTQIVQEIESRLSVCDNLEFVIRNSIEKAEALRQSILKKAFEGKLLSEAEIAQCKAAADYEPASELLKKIQAEKLAKEQKKKGKNAK